MRTESDASTSAALPRPQMHQRQQRLPLLPHRSTPPASIARRVSAQQQQHHPERDNSSAASGLQHPAAISPLRVQSEPIERQLLEFLLNIQLLIQLLGAGAHGLRALPQQVPIVPVASQQSFVQSERLFRVHAESNGQLRAHRSVAQVRAARPLARPLGGEHLGLRSGASASGHHAQFGHGPPGRLVQTPPPAASALPQAESPTVAALARRRRASTAALQRRTASGGQNSAGHQNAAGEEQKSRSAAHIGPV